jgi:hypothetical protein
VRIESVLATVAGAQDTERLSIINQGLPNVEAGFPSDHIPIGALFVPTWVPFSSSESDNDSVVAATSLSTSTNEASQESFGHMKDDDHNNNNNDNNTVMKSNSDEFHGSSGTNMAGRRRRRELGLESMSIRRRHNLVLRVVAEWLEHNGAQEMFRDLPLYKNPWTYMAPGLTKKSRAPDIIGRIQNCLVVVEVTVVTPTKVESIAWQKQDKYSDLAKILPSCPTIQQAGLTVEDPMILVLDETGGIPESTRQSILRLASLLHPMDSHRAQEEAQVCMNRLQECF